MPSEIPIPDDFDDVRPSLQARLYGTEWANIEYLAALKVDAESGFGATHEINDSVMLGAVVDLGERTARVTPD
ncbi:MAG: hypothetical protein LBJ08_01620, partial [Bifidobacteriaceae bacterium]|nr:hypothetical protein [Bifidobacteriaceae bacterium]